MKLSLLLLLLCLVSFLPGYSEVKEVGRKDPRWKQRTQLTIKTDNKTRRTFEKEKSGDNSFFYIAGQENAELFWIDYKFKPVGKDEAKNRVEPMFEWGIIPAGQKKVINQKKTKSGETVKEQERYEADLSSLKKTGSLKIACRMIAYWYNDGEKVTRPDTGEAKIAPISPPSFKINMKEITFNTEEGKINADAFDVQESINGNNIPTPEFKEGRERQGTVVVYPAGSAPTIKIVAELSSDDLPAEKWKGLGITLKATGSDGGDSLIPGKEWKTRQSMEMEEGADKNIQILKGNVQVQGTLDKQMKQGKLQLTWKVDLEGGELDCKTETSITNSFLILRQKEIETQRGTPKLWKQALLTGAGHLLKKADHKTVLSHVANSTEYAEALVKGIIYHSVYAPDPRHPKYSVQERGHYTVQVSSILQEYEGNSYPPLICVESAGTLYALFHLMTDDTISIRRASPVAKPGIPLPPTATGHAFNVLNGKIYDAVPFIQHTNPVVHTDAAIPSAHACGGDIQKRLDEMTKNEPYNYRLVEGNVSITIK